MNEEIEVPVGGDTQLSKYLARIPKSLFQKARRRCAVQGTSINTMIVLALNQYLDGGEIVMPQNRRLSDVVLGELGAMEARLMAAIKPSPVSKSLEMDIVTTPMAPLHEHQCEVDDTWARRIGVKAASTREGASFVLPEALLTVPGSLEWDGPTPPEQRLWPEQPPVNKLAPRALDGQGWKITGSLDAITSSRAREILADAGALVTNTFYKKTAAVLAGADPDPRVLDAAEAYGVPVWTEAQFLQMAYFIGADVKVPV